MTDRSTSYPNWTLVATMCASSFAFIDGSVTNVALSSIEHSFGGAAGGAVAPLTTAVLSSVDHCHTGTVSGFNNAISRTGA